MFPEVLGVRQQRRIARVNHGDPSPTELTLHASQRLLKPAVRADEWLAPSLARQASMTRSGINGLDRLYRLISH